MAKILIVEDNKLNLQLFHDLLAMKSHEIFQKTDGYNIIDKIIDIKPDLILMDIQLGKISGLDIIKEIKQNNAIKNIPIIAITAFAMQNEQEIIYKSGCDMYLSKPVSVDKFFEAIDKFI